MTNQNKLAEFLDADPSQTELLVYLRLASTLDYHRPHYLNISRFARDIGRSRSRVNEAINRLIELGVLERDPADPHLYKINSALTWQGVPA